jgi:hypothetical protein
VWACKSYTQERTALRNSIYSGTDGTLINPAFSTDQGVFISVNLVGADVFLMNSLMQASSTTYWTLDEDNLVPTKKALLSKDLFANIAIEGPSASVNIGRYGGGFFTRFRNMIDLRHVPEEFGDLYLSGFDYSKYVGQSIRFKNVELNTQSWAEFGLNFSTMLPPRNYRAVMVGGSLKYLKAIQATRFNIDEFNYTVGKDGNSLERIAASYKTSTPGGSSWFTGSGFSADIGLAMKEYDRSADHYHPHKKYSNCEFWDYKFRWSASLMDLGLMRMSGDNASDKIDTSFTTSVYVEHSSDLGGGIEEQSLRKSTEDFWIFMPASINLDADYSLGHSFYANAALSMPLIPRALPGLQSPGFLTLSPRFERKNIALMLPFTLYRFSQPLLGLCLRIRSFYVGSNSIVPLFIPTHIHGVNVYLGAKINIYRNHACDKELPKEKKKKVRANKFKKDPPLVPSPSNPPSGPAKDPEETPSQDPKSEPKPGAPVQIEINEFPKEEKPTVDPKNTQDEVKPIDGGSNFIKEEIKVDGPDNTPTLDQDEVKEILDADPGLNIQQPEIEKK